MKKLFASLTARLVLTAVALVMLVSIGIAGAATIALHSRLTSQLDDQLTQSAQRYLQPDQNPFSASHQSPGTLVAVFLPSGSQPLPNGKLAEGVVFGYSTSQQMSSTALTALGQVSQDGDIHGVELPALGSYRVETIAVSGGVLVFGLSTNDVGDAVSTLITYEVLLILLGGLIAAGVGLFIVRRQLRPLVEVAQTAHSVAMLPLSSGEVDLSERVPDHLTDEHTEVGQVGSALNALLAHVEQSLSERQRSELQVRQFVADASHELRTPLATIAGYTQLARRRPDDEAAVRTALGKVEEESARMTGLVEDLLLLARLDSGRPLEHAPVDLTRMLLEAVSDARVLAPDHRWQLELPEDAGTLPEVDGDEQRLHQVVTNLLTNARKYTPAGTTVTVSARPDGFTVHDDGPGFPDDLQEHAFERFVRGDTSRNREGGAGLGLALVAAIVRSHGGEVELVSAPGDTTITVRLRPVALPVPAG